MPSASDLSPIRLSDLLSTAGSVGPKGVPVSAEGIPTVFVFISASIGFRSDPRTEDRISLPALYGEHDLRYFHFSKKGTTPGKAVEERTPGHHSMISSSPG